MTTGEKLLSMSTLPSGSAMDHFTHISTGGGTYPVEEIKVSSESGVSASYGGIYNVVSVDGTIMVSLQGKISADTNSEITA